MLLLTRGNKLEDKSYIYYLTESLKYTVSLHLKQWKVAPRYLNTSVGLWVEILQEVDLVPLGLGPLHLQRERAVRAGSGQPTRVQGFWTCSALGST